MGTECSWVGSILLNPEVRHLAKEMLESKTERVPFSSCWYYSIDTSKRYKSVRIFGCQIMAHRLSYQAYKGVIPDGRVLDHLCGETSCINPEHLDPVTDGVNTRRARKPGSRPPPFGPSRWSGRY